MRADRPLVSVIIPCFNQARFLPDSLDSVARQSYGHREVLVVNDGSTDDVAGVAGQFTGVRCVTQRNQGTAAARNLGFRESRGQYVLFLDADDRLLPDALATGMDTFIDRPDCGLVYGHVRLFEADPGDCRCPPQVAVPRAHYRELLARNYIWTPGAVLYRRSVIDEVGGFDPRAGGSADFDLNIRIARRWPIHCHGRLVLDYRTHPDSQSTDPAYMLRSAVSVRRRHRRLAREPRRAHRPRGRHPRGAGRLRRASDRPIRPVRPSGRLAASPTLPSRSRALPPGRARPAAPPPTPSLVTMPAVSVVVPFLNARPFMEESIESVRGQTYPDWELLLVDDGSRDGTSDIARAHASRDPERVRYFEHPGHARRGASAARNLGLHHARGQYIAFLDADDVWLPEKLASQVAIIEAHPEAAMVYNRTQYWHSWTGAAEDRPRDFVERLGVASNTLVEPPRLLTLILRQESPVPCTCSVLIRRSAVEQVHGFEEGFIDLFTDQAFYAKVFLSMPVFAADGCWDRYRQHPDQSCATAERTGRIRAARRGFLEWLEGYMIEHGFRGSEVWQALGSALEQYRSEPGGSAASLAPLLKRQARGLARRVLPVSAQDWLRRRWRGAAYTPPVGLVRWGDLRRMTPVSGNWGLGRGLPVDRYYIEQFLARHAADIRGSVLEVGDDRYTRKFGGVAVTASGVLNVGPGHPATTIVADLSRPEQVPAGRFDCVIVTQTLQLIADLEEHRPDPPPHASARRGGPGDAARHQPNALRGLGRPLAVELHRPVGPVALRVGVPSGRRHGGDPRQRAGRHRVSPRPGRRGSATGRTRSPRPGLPGVDPGASPEGQPGRLMAAVGAPLLSTLRPILVCPLCKGDLDVAAGAIACRTGHLRVEQTRPDCVDLLPREMGVADLERWSERQAAMTQWYRDLLATPADAAACFEQDYRAYAGILQTLSGRVLDIGGGNGVVRHYLGATVQYIALEPDLAWLDAPWADLADRFACLAAPPFFVRGIGERMPFTDASFDAALGFWSLNHAVDPSAVIAETARVLRPGGLLLLVLEDMPPRWLDLATSELLSRRPRRTARLVAQKVGCSLLGRTWPLQPDHVRLTEDGLRTWAAIGSTSRRAAGLTAI